VVSWSRSRPRRDYSRTFSSCWPTTILSELLFVYDLDLLIDHLPGKPVDGHVHPVMLFAFDKKACKSGSVGRIAAALGNHTNQQVPGATLAGIVAMRILQPPCERIAPTLCFFDESGRN
jgi:hypothetical protein